MNTQDFIAIEEKYGAHNYKPLDVVLTDGKGAWVTDVDGKRYLDCLSAIPPLTKVIATPKSSRQASSKLKKLV